MLKVKYFIVDAGTGDATEAGTGGGENGNRQANRLTTDPHGAQAATLHAHRFVHPTQNHHHGQGTGEEVLLVQWLHVSTE